ncbi:MAG: DUF3137 domain-containing protein [Oligoflexia bacterium]|nr:DUF3137 domain-containing protein [Oligoflexia bacterium]
MDKKSFRKLFKNQLKKHTKKISSARAAYYPGLFLPTILLYVFLKDYPKFLIPSLSLYFIFYSAIFNKYIKGLKVTIVRPLLETLFPNFDYRLDSSIGNFDIANLNLFKGDISNFNSQDELYGKVNDHSFSLAEIKFNSDSLNFNGLVLKISMKKALDKDLVLGPRGKVFAYKRKKVTGLSNFILKYFDVYCDEFESVPIGIIPFIEKVSKWSRKKVFVSIGKKEIYIFFSHSSDLLEPKLVGELISYKDVQIYKKYLSLIKDLVQYF